MVIVSKASVDDVKNYWSFVLKFPEPSNPLKDRGALTIPELNPQGNLVSLPGNTGGGSTRNIRDPLARDNTIFVPVNPVVVTQSEAPEGGDLTELARKDEDSAKKATLTINDEEHDLLLDEGFRVRTGLFDVTLPQQAILHLSAGTQKAAGDGYYAKVQEIPVADNNKIEMHALVEKPFNQASPWESSLKYNFRVT